MFEKDFLKRLMQLSLPICFQAFMLAAVAAADAFMLGSEDQNWMSAVSLATQIQFVQNMVLYALVGATSVMGAQYWGKKDREALDDIFGLSLRIGGLVSAAFALGCLLCPEFLMRIYTNDGALIEIGVRYLRVAGISYLLSGISQCYLVMMKVSCHIRAAAVCSTVSVVMNIVLNAVFIFWADMGVEGAALATLISRIIEFAIAVGLSFRSDYLRPKLKKLFCGNRTLTIDYLKCFGPLLGAGLLWGLGFTSYTSFMGHLGEDAAGANSITAVVRDLVCCTCDGLAGGCTIMVGNELGAGKLEKGRSYGERIMKLSFVVGFSSTAIMLLLTPLVLFVVKLTPGARTYLVQMMLVMSVYVIGRSVNTIIINGLFAAGGDTMFDMYSLAITMWGIAVPLAALGTFVLNWPVVVVYACTCLDEVGKIPWVILHFRKYKWVKDLTRENLQEQNEAR